MGRFYTIEGGQCLKGEVSVSGAKNAAGKQLVASLLTSDPCVFTNMPRITEVDLILDMMESMGTIYEWKENGDLHVRTPEIITFKLDDKFAGFNRIPILFLGALLQRTGTIEVPEVGGCNIGPRPVDFHIESLKKMGAKIELLPNGYHATAEKGLVGAHIKLDFPSVGATENVIMAAVMATGTTIIEGAAIEPEIIDTVLFLQKMGAVIHIGADRKIVIEGVKSLHGASHHTITDRIEVASFAIAATATNGEIYVKNARHEDMIAFLNAFQQAGGGFEVRQDGIFFFRANKLKTVHIETNVHPGFMTDWQQPMLILLTQAEGTSIIHETVYENRFLYTNALKEMGAKIELSVACLGSKECRLAGQGHLHSCIIHGPTALEARDITITDLRAGFAFLIAALLASGKTKLYGVQYLERGYSNIVERLRSLNAVIEIGSDDTAS